MASVIIEKLSEVQIAERNIRSWPVWTKEISTFDWYYDGDEHCLVLEGDIEVETSEGTYKIKPGDFVTFKKGLKCKWNVIKPVRKHYFFP